jgi:hypothetical protein
MVINFERNNTSSLTYDYFLIIFSYAANVVGVIFANYLMRGGKSIRGLVFWGSLMMIATPTALHWLHMYAVSSPTTASY